ncbi:LOW QUALITY PROTEIN: DNA primase large subunit-like [Uloborus diversus]|uniref:LOW QUALITY PROTEIN: DNA primase large subunit-like n=1 Tax=Uloborus diversus TaxID=327109 RepID=UPI00240904EF|nr:LOW QUALITY PROTEIN: DNA primase large subunit-like [Uloborus diversus]
MQFNPRRHLLTAKKDNLSYPHSLQFYKCPPVDNITLEEFEELALERLKVLRIIERAGAKFNKNSNDYKEMILNELKKLNLLFYFRINPSQNNDEKIYNERKKDNISHFILRLAYCRREDLRRWFITQEVDLFRLRFISEKTASRKLFMDQNNLNYKPIDDSEKNSILENLCVGYCNSIAKVRSTNFYKVPFVEVLDLVKNRKVYLKKGYAYITEDDLVVTVVSAYRAHLSHALAVTCRALPQLDEDTRLINMLQTLHQRYIGTDYSNRKTEFVGDVSLEAIDSLSKTSFPLCMRNLHDALRKTHHLKYNGRLQYGLFLKGIGLSLEDALRFWREEFTKVMDMDKFDKQYMYNIRYNYGKEGKRANFSPYSCIKIITSNSPGAGEFHGCPYKHFDENNLRQKLHSTHLNSSGINEVMDLAAKGHYQIACTRYFELTHQDMSVDQGINHPNQYFEESQKIAKGIKKNDKTYIQNTVPRTSASIKHVKESSETNKPANDDMEMDTESIEDIEGLLAGLQGV